jgi:chromate reductase, NAD(P)H dehydrogenase (quinone)
MTSSLLAFAGSCRQHSYNHALLKATIELAATQTPELTITLINLADYPLPLFNEDDEASLGHPPALAALKTLMAQHHGLLIASPEYNSLPSPLLINTISWLSRQAPGEAPLAAFQGKVAGLMSASPGALGGLRGLPIVRHGLQNIGVTVVPQLVAVSQAHTALPAEGPAALPDAVKGMIRTQLDQLQRHLRTA